MLNVTLKNLKILVLSTDTSKRLRRDGTLTKPKDVSRSVNNVLKVITWLRITLVSNFQETVWPLILMEPVPNAMKATILRTGFALSSTYAKNTDGWAARVDGTVTKLRDAKKYVNFARRDTGLIQTTNVNNCHQTASKLTRKEPAHVALKDTHWNMADARRIVTIENLALNYYWYLSRVLSN